MRILIPLLFFFAQQSSACLVDGAQLTKLCTLRAFDEGKTNCGKNKNGGAAYVADCDANCGYENEEFFSDYYWRVTGQMPPGDDAPFPPAAPSHCAVASSDNSHEDYLKKYCHAHPNDGPNCGGGGSGGAWMCRDGSPCGPSVFCLDNSRCTFYH